MTILDEIFDHEEALQTITLVKKKPAILKCRFCSWQIPKFKTTKKGKRVNLYGELQSHVMIAHPEEYQNLQDKLEVE